MKQLSENIISKQLFLISGPCSAETEEQVFDTFRRLKPLNPNVLRAGIWKPRTRPNTFEGVGAIGLDWVKRASLEVGIPVMVEVATTKHLELALKAGVDMIWIGARTTVNPFAVQELADGLKGVSIPVFIKNPVNPDLELWMGAIERITRAGVKQISAIHRGFSTFEKTIYRNDPNWEIPIELKRRIPEIKIICDPSHITGQSELLAQVAQMGLDLDFDGLMIESHSNPKEAWSDARQQITPEELHELILGLHFRHANLENIELVEILKDLRNNIDQIDHNIVELLAKRMEFTSKIAESKAAYDITILQPKRWAEIVDNRLKQSADLGLKQDFILKIFQHIHQQSIQLQTDIFDKLQQTNKQAI